MGMEINQDETKYLVWEDEQHTNNAFLEVNTDGGRLYKFEEVEKFTYL